MSGFGYNILGFGAFPNRTVEAGITSNAENVSAKAQFNATIWASGTPKILNISSGVTLGGTGGTAALTIESDLGGSLLIVNAGTIIGTGGAAGSSGAGGNGGNAILNSGGSIVSVTNSGTISGGGGGGGLGGTGGTGGNGTYTSTSYGYVHGSRSWWVSSSTNSYIIYGGTFCTGMPSSQTTCTYGGVTYRKGSYVQYGGPGAGGYQLGIDSTATQSGASGGAGGAGGAGAGYNQSQSDGSSGSSGSSGSNNAGSGGAGGTGGNGGNAGANGSAGATGSTGANGNASNGSSGSSGSAGGTAGKAISGAVNFTDASGTTNGTVDTV